MLTVLLFNALHITSCAAKKGKYSSFSLDYFDTVTTVTGYETTRKEFEEVSNRILNELNEYHKLFTVYDRYDGINNLCALNTVSDGVHPRLKVDQKIIDMLLFAKKTYEKTNGKVNIAMGSVLSIWHDYRERGNADPVNASIPPAELLEEAAKHTDIANMIIDDENDMVFLADPKMLLDVGAIAKGFAVERIAEGLENDGISGYVINVGGNVRTIGARGDGKPWIVGIDNPDGSDEEPYYTTLALEDLSLVTSGSYQRFYTVNGKSYNHIIDPYTLMPSDTYISVSVLCKSSAIADALSTALFSMSIEQGEQLIADLENVHAMWVFANGTIKYSSGFSHFITSE